MRTNCRALWATSPVDSVNRYAYLAGKLGAAPELSRPFLICIRGAALGEDETHEMHARPAYDDTGVLLTRTSMPLVFRMGTHSYQVDSRESPDVNRDGRGDVGSILPGRFILRDTGAGKYPVFRVLMPDGSDRIPCQRDVNHDGAIGGEELVNAYTATSILLHTGWDAPPDSPHRSSIGCLTASATTLGGIHHEAVKADGKIDCVLETAERCVELLGGYVRPDAVANA